MRKSITTTNTTCVTMKFRWERRATVPKVGGRLVEVDGSLDIEDMIGLVEQHFKAFLPPTNPL